MHYLRIQPLPIGEFDLLMGSGENHKTGQADDISGTPGPARVEAALINGRANTGLTRL